MILRKHNTKWEAHLRAGKANGSTKWTSAEFNQNDSIIIDEESNLIECRSVTIHSIRMEKIAKCRGKEGKSSEHNSGFLAKGLKEN